MLFKGHSVCNRFFYASGWKDVFKVEYNDPHKFAPKLRGFPFTVRTNTLGHFQPYAFYRQGLHTLFIDQLVRSKATCSFKDCVDYTFPYIEIVPDIML